MNKHLYDEIAKRWYRGGSVWIYSDPHFGDEEMKYLRTNYIGDDEQVKRINSKIGKNDTIIFLGDIGDVSYIKKIRGYKVLIMGNHDKGASNYKRLPNPHLGVPYVTEDKISKLPEEIQRLKNYVIDNQLFDEVYEGPLMINDRLILSHEPFPTSGTLFNIHGHDHSKQNKANNSLNVCAEHIDYTPVNLTALIKEGLLKSVISSHRETINIANKRAHKKNKYKSLQSEN